MRKRLVHMDAAALSANYRLEDGSMAKRIKFALEMKDGQSVRDIEGLKEYFDLEKLVEHFKSGKLKIWLEDRRYDD